MLLCGNCGARVEPNQRHCEDCGQVVNRGEHAATPPPAQILAGAESQTGTYQQNIASVGTKPNRILLVVAGLLTVAFSVGITVWLFRGNDDATLNENPRPDPLPAVQITASASSTRNAAGDLTYLPNNMIDGNLATAWVEGVAGSGVGEWIRFDFDREVELLRLRIAPGYFKSSHSWTHNNRLAAVTIFLSDGSTRNWYLGDRMEQQDFGVGGVKTRWVRMTIDQIYPGARDSDDSPISEMTFDLKL